MGQSTTSEGSSAGVRMFSGQLRSRKRLSRSFSPNRWREYSRLLEQADVHGYEIVSLEPWLLDGGTHQPARLMLMRHDVDQHPRSALAMSDIELTFGITSTWYFRWRTAEEPVITELRRRGNAIGLHYETLTRLVLKQGPAALDRLDEARATLAREVVAFEERFGPIKTIAPHGDTRVPEVSNLSLVLDQDPGQLGVAFDANLAMRDHALGLWLTDRSSPDGGWAEGVDPHAVFETGVSPILCLTHPNNWTSGLSLWLDRALGRQLARLSGHRWIATGSDHVSLDA